MVVRRWLDVDVEVLDTAAARGRGLLGRASLDPGSGVWIAPCRQVHTIGMRFPIDVAFCAADGTVLHLSAPLPTWRMTRWVRGAAGALEVAAGALAAAGVEVGDRLAWRGGPFADGSSSPPRGPRATGP